MMLVILVTTYLLNCDNSISFTVFSENELFHILIHKFILHIIENKFSKMETFIIGYFSQIIYYFSNIFLSQSIRNAKIITSKIILINIYTVLMQEK